MAKYHWLVLALAQEFALQSPNNNISCNAFSTPSPTTRRSSSSSSSSIKQQKNENVNFVDWISDAPNEIKSWKPLAVEGSIPPYVEGTLVRNGGGIWTSPSESEENNMYSHIFDGLAKIHSYRISHEEESSRVDHQARFLEGSWYNQYMTTKKLPIGIGIGPMLNEDKRPITGLWRTVRAVLNTAINFDNTCVNIWDYQPSASSKDKVLTALTDAPPRTRIDLETMNTLSSSTINPISKGSKGYEMVCTAHPLYSQKPNDTDTYNCAVEIGPSGSRVNLIKESTNTKGIGERTVVTSFPFEDGTTPYMHSFGLSRNHAVIVLQPLRINTANLGQSVEVGFLRAMDHVDYTRIVVVDLNSGDIALDKSIDEKVYFYHTVSTAEIMNDGNGDDLEVSLRLCAYETSDMITGEHQFMRLEQARQSKELRNKISKSKFCDLRCNLSKQTVNVEWNNEIQQPFELPITRYSRSYGEDAYPTTGGSKEKGGQDQLHPRYVYAFGYYAHGGEYENWGLFKFDMEENKIVDCYIEDSVYISEPAFVADPEGTSEDDGVLLTHAYFGRERQTKLLVLDAKTMKVLAEAPTGHRAPLDFHGAWIPAL
mmetsp:Transcript_5158/g.11210  ORF Transcript_5158/g.11210 Transcript_5158/m.11210 type:complete len:597 (-) Transcript_5158:45-1835(-)